MDLLLSVLPMHWRTGSHLVQDVYEQVPAAKALFDRASEVLGYDLLEACVEGATQRKCSSLVMS